MRIFPSLLIASMLVAVAPATLANQLWRCPGNVFTDEPASAEQSKCILVNTEEALTVHPSDQEQTPQYMGDLPARDFEAEKKEKERAVANTIKHRQLLKQIAQSKQELAALEAEYNNGEPQRVGVEFRNYQLYLNKVERLKKAVEQKRSEVANFEAQINQQ